jgi:hypothetical protein
MTAIVHAVTGIEGAGAGAELVRALREKLGDAKPTLVVCFASMAQPLGALLAALREGFGGAPTVGLSTAGEFTEKGEHHKSAVAVAIVGDFIAHTAMTSGGTVQQVGIRVAEFVGGWRKTDESDAIST